MAVSIDIAGSFLQSLFLPVRICGIGKIPYVYVCGGFAADLHGAVLAKYVQGFFQILGVYVGGSLDGGYGSVLEFHHSHSYILGLQIAVKLLSGLSVDFLHFVPEGPS